MGKKRGRTMPQTPEDLSKIIREMAQRYAKNESKRLSVTAEDRIAVIPPPYQSRPVITVDLTQLDLMVGRIILLASSFSGSEIGLDAMERSLRQVKCHYLWFC
jgi:hypothetical protein